MSLQDMNTPLTVWFLCFELLRFMYTSDSGMVPIFIFGWSCTRLEYVMILVFSLLLQPAFQSSNIDYSVIL